MKRKAVGLLVLIAACLRRALRRAAGDERRQALDIVVLTAIGLMRLTILLLMAILIGLTVLARLALMTRLEIALVRLLALFTLFARLIGLRLARLLLLVRLFARRMRFVTRLRIVVAVEAILVRIALLERLALPELLLGRRDQAEIVFGMLVIILGSHRIAGCGRIACKLDVFLGDVIRRAADFHVRPV